MNLKPTYVEFENDQPAFLMSGKNLEWTVGNITLDSADFTVGDVVAPGTAVFRDESTGLYKKVAEDTPATMEAPVLTGHAVVINHSDSNESVAGLKKGSVYTELLTGVTDNFKEAVQGRIVFDL